MKNMVDDFVKPNTNTDTVDPVDEPKSDTSFTDDERDAYYIIKAIASSVIKPIRVTYRDRKSYCNILLDDNINRKIARLYFNNSENKKIVIFAIDADRNESSETFSIEDLNEIHQYSDMIKAIVISQDRVKSAKS